MKIYDLVVLEENILLWDVCSIQLQVSSRNGGKFLSIENEKLRIELTEKDVYLCRGMKRIQEKSHQLSSMIPHLGKKFTNSRLQYEQDS